MPMATRAEVEGALARARRFFLERQRPNGEFVVKFHLANEAGALLREEFDSSAFVTMYLSHAVLSDGTPEILACVRRAAAFLDAERNGAGVWRYFGRSSRFWKVAPCDADSTSGVLLLREALALAGPDTRRMLLENRDRRGRFYTWFTPGNVRSLNAQYWWFVLRDLNLARLYFFWRRTWAHRRDVDVVVNANVVRYLGEGRATSGASEWILETVRVGAEERRDKWYQDRATLYHAMGRAYHSGIRAFGEVRDPIAERIAERAGVDGCIGGCALHTALSAAALCYFGFSGDLLDRAVSSLLSSQDDEGGWPSHPYFYGGWKRLAWWGSREVTTAFAIEALNLYLKHAPGVSIGDVRAIDA